MKVKTKFFAAIGVLIGTTFVGVGVTTYLLTSRHLKSNDTSAQRRELIVTQNGDVEQSFDLKSLSKIKLNKPNHLNEEEFAKKEEEYNNIPENANDLIVEKSFTAEGIQFFYKEYVDPYTGIKFRDYSYYTEPNTGQKRYFLGENGLALLAFEFRRKVTFGPEVNTLDSINVNNFNVIESGANGIYIPALRQIHINSFSSLEAGLDLYSKVKGMMGTLFHEYMHHWASTYAEIGNPMANTNRTYNIFTQGRIRNANVLTRFPFTTRIRYYGTSNSTRSADGFWSTYFAYNFYRLLNYDTTETFRDARESAFEIENGEIDYRDELRYSTLTNYSFNHYSLNEIFTFANAHSSYYPTPNNAYRSLINKFQTTGYVNFANFGTFSSGQTGVSPETIRYLYSLTELVPREWSKFAFDPYFKPSERANFVQNPSNPGQSWGLAWGGFYKNQRNGQSTFIPSSLGDDWSKVYLMNLSAIRNGAIGPYNFDKKDVVYPNTVKSLQGSTWENLWKNTPRESKITDRSKDFYSVFLNTMGYGKTISQIITDVKQPPVGTINGAQPEKETQSQIKFLGYLPQDTKFKGLVFENTSNSATPYQVAEFQFKNFFDFFKEDKRELENELTNNQEFKSYITKDFVNFATVDTNKTIKYWEDKNNDSNFTPDEIVSGTITLPTNRFTTTLNTANKDYRTNSSFSWYSLSQTTEGVKILLRKFRQ